MDFTVEALKLALMQKKGAILTSPYMELKPYGMEIVKFAEYFDFLMNPLVETLIQTFFTYPLSNKESKILKLL